MALAVKIAATILCLLKKNLLTQKLSFNGKGQKGGKKKGLFLKTFLYVRWLDQKFKFS